MIKHQSRLQIFRCLDLTQKTPNYKEVKTVSHGIPRAWQSLAKGWVGQTKLVPIVDIPERKDM